MNKLLKAFFKRRHPYAPVAYMGRKNFEKTMNCKVMKRKDLEKIAKQESRMQG
jgi:hypothetical protein